MKKLLLFCFVLLFAGNIFAQVAPVIGPSSVCVGSPNIYTDATLGGTWSSSNTGIATVGSTTGIVTPVSPGTTNIIYRVGAVFSSLTITVNPLPNPISGRTVLCAGRTGILADAGSGIWTSTNTSVAKVGSLSGVVTAIGAGTTNIIYTLPVTGCQTSTSFLVNPNPAPITGYTNVYTGTTTYLADATPGGNWTSGNNTLAGVVSGGIGLGVVTGISSGEVMISYTLPTTGCLSFIRVHVNPFPDSGLVAWYPFCNDLHDYGGGGYDLINGAVGAVPGTTPALDTTDRFNVRSSAFYFDGNNTTMSYSTFFPLSGPFNSFTYSCWIYPMAAQNSIILYNGNPSTTAGGTPPSGWGFMMDDGAGGPGTKVSVLFAEQTPAIYIPTDLMPLGGLNNWYNLLLLKNGNSYRFYINGTLIGFFVLPSVPSIVPAAGTFFTLGQDYTNIGSRAFNGKIDDVTIFNNQLSNQGITDILAFNPDAAKFTLGNDTTICSDSITLYPSPQTLSSAYYWSTGDTTDTAVTVSPVQSLFFGSQYILTIYKPYGCRAADTITVYKALMPVRLGVDTNICLGDTLMIGQDSRGRNYFPGANFIWSTGDTTHYLDVAQSGTYSVVVDSGACVGRDTIKITTRRVPRIDLGPDVANCTGKIDTITNAWQSYDSGYSYNWSVGTTNDSLIVTTSGTFWLKVTDSGCSRFDTISVLIVYDTVTLFTPDTGICKGDFVIPNVTINPIISYNWTPTAGIALSNIAQPTIRADTSATYTLRAAFPGCPDIYKSFHIDVQPVPSLYMGGNKPLCQFDTLHVHATVSPDWYTNYIYNWTPSTHLDHNNTPDVVFTANNTSDSTILVLSVTTPAGCKVKDSIAIYVYPGSYEDAMVNPVLCPGDSVQLNPVLNPRGIAYGVVRNIVWSPSMYLDNANTTNPWVKPITTTDYVGIGTSQYGCLDTVTVTVKVKPAAIIYLGDSVVLHPGEPAYHIPTQTNCVYFSWFPPTGLDDTSRADPTANPNTNTIYVVHASTEDGCTVADSISIRRDPGTPINVPNAFTPGGYNSTLKVIINRFNGTGVATLNYFRIYDRWGNKIFETTNIDEGWDGTFNGKPAPFGVYVYDAQAITSDGKLFDKHGNVTLIR